VQTSGQALDGLLVWSLTVLLQVVALLTASVWVTSASCCPPHSICITHCSYASTAFSNSTGSELYKYEGHGVWCLTSRNSAWV